MSNSLIKYGLIAAGAYVAYEMFMKPGVTAAAISSTAPSTGSVPPVVTTPAAVSSVVVPPVTQPPAPATPQVNAKLPPQFQTSLAASLAAAHSNEFQNQPNLLQMLVWANGGNTNASADQWNYWYTQLSGVQQTADLFVDPNNRSAPMNVNDYVSARGAKGLSGYSWGYMGRQQVRPMYANPYRGIWG